MWIIARPLALAATLLACLAGSALAEEAAKKRFIDNFGGITFFCRADDRQAWTRRSCATITAEVVRQVEAAGIRIGVLQPGDTAEKVAAAAGFSSETALSMLFLFEGSPSGNTALNFTAEARLEIWPGVKTGWRQVASQTTTLDPGDWSDEAEKAAATVFAGILEFFTTPR